MKPSSPPGIVLVIVALALAAGAAPEIAQAQDDGSAVIEYRQSIMQSFRVHMGGVRAALRNTVPIDHARNHAVAFHAMAESLANAFPEGSMSSDSRALATIWEHRNDFMTATRKPWVRHFKPSRGRAGSVTASTAGRRDSPGHRVKLDRGPSGWRRTGP